MADYIPLEVQEEIMKRLPTKSLMQFRSVSKPWKSLIDSPKFIANYSFGQQHLLVSSLPIPKHRFVSVVDDDTNLLEKVYLSVPISGLHQPKVLGSSQGLFCLHNSYRLNLKTLHIWNPSIRKTVGVNVSNYLPVDLDSYTVFGFGVCPHTSDPKLVKVRFSKSLLEMDTYTYTPWQVEVYTLSSRAWRSIPTINQPSKSVLLFRNQVVISEFIYWFAVDGAMPHRRKVIIVSFDLTSEGFMEISLPGTLARAYIGNMVICKLKESLVVVHVVKEAEKQVYGVWMMEHGVSKTFAKLFTINLTDTSIRALLGFWKNNEPIFALRTDYDVHNILVQEHHSGHISYIGILGDGCSYDARSYTETLLLLDY